MPKPVQKPIREKRISVRIPARRFPDLKCRLRHAADTCNVDESVLVLAAIDGICSFVERWGEVAFPVRVTLRALQEAVNRLGKKRR